MKSEDLHRPVRAVVVKVTEQRVVDRGQPVTAGKMLYCGYGWSCYCLPALARCDVAIQLNSIIY
jgi:hypothetical protein